MQNLGLADSTPKADRNFKRQFWGEITDRQDAALLVRGGVWMLLGCGITVPVVSLSRGNVTSAAVECLFFALAAAGVRRISRAASALGGAALLLLFLDMPRYSVNRDVLAIAFQALFAVIFSTQAWNALRGALWIVRQDQPSAPEANGQFDAALNRAAAAIWPRARWAFFALSAIVLSALVFHLFTPIAPGSKWRGVLGLPWM